MYSRWLRPWYIKVINYPVEFFIKQRTLNYWGKIITSKDHKINKILYQLAITLEKKRILKKSGWLLYVKTALNDSNMYNCWLNQSICEKSLVLFKRNVKKASGKRTLITATYVTIIEL